MRRQLAPAVIVFLCLTLLVGVLYPLAVTAAAQLAFGDRANGSLFAARASWSAPSLLGQAFTGARWFHPRPSAAGDGYDGTASGASNLGPTNPKLVRGGSTRRAVAYRLENGLRTGAPVPVGRRRRRPDQGLDPDISPTDARLQAHACRPAPAARCRWRWSSALVRESTHGRTLGFHGKATESTCSR